jgi:hypothetical protein
MSETKKWRGEGYPVYACAHDHPSRPAGSEANFGFEIERSACTLFGVIAYSVHMMAFQEFQDLQSGASKQTWVPKWGGGGPSRRASSGYPWVFVVTYFWNSWPGYLDNSAAGVVVKELMEEASIEEDVVRKHDRTVGTISLFSRRVRCGLVFMFVLTGSFSEPAGSGPGSLPAEASRWQS